LHGVKWTDLGELVAIRLRQAASILDGGCIRYYCWGGAQCPACKVLSPLTDYTACSQGTYDVCLGYWFWNDWKNLNLASNDLTVLHECLHIYFKDIRDDFKDIITKASPTRPLGNAHCYIRFVACINRLPASLAPSSRCSAGACEPTVLDSFRFDGAELRPHHAPLIDQIAYLVVASWDTSCPVKNVVLTGFTDSVEHTAGYNVKLGMNRALSARDGIATRIRALDPTIAANVKFGTFSLASALPVGNNATDAGRAQNRRVQVILQPS